VKVVHGRADARWLPSRHNFALFRLAAYLRLRRAKPEPRNVSLMIDRHQSTTETWIVLSWIVFTMSCYCAATLFRNLHVALALLISLPIVFVLLHVLPIVTALTIAPLFRNHIRVNSFLVMLMFAAASAYFAVRPGWVRFVAWQFLGMLALDAVAAVVVFALNDSITQLEARFGGEPSAP
jgi:hypothetical protein